ncbi:hypothetical protein ACIQM0_35040 [Streptomyces sp. NPDC091387]|uniref:hypothetical protein n=1 Tax=Streptomyces sp. NPDC091387 TaxID=3365998 RepID=UPI0038096E13
MDRLHADELRHTELALRLMVEVSEMTSLAELRRSPDADMLIAEAQEAVSELKKCVDRHRGPIADDTKFATDLAAHKRSRTAGAASPSDWPS